MALWGTSYAATKFALVGFSPMAVVWLRMAIASVAMLAFLPRVPRPRYRAGDWKWLVAIGVLEPCLYFLFEGNALHFTTSSQAGMISALVPLLVAAGAWLFLAESTSGRALAGLAISLGGVAMLSVGGGAASSAPNPALGNVLELLATVAAAGYMLVLKHLSDRYSPWLLTGLQAFTGAVFFLPGAVVMPRAAWVAAPASAWVAAVYLGLFVTLGAFGLYNVAVCRMPASRAAASINLVPLVAMGTGALLLGDTLTPVQMCAALVIAGGVALAQARLPAAAREPVPEGT